MEKLPAPAPAATSTPRVSTSIDWLRAMVVSTLPTAMSTAPTTITRPGPQRSATTPKTGCEAPHTNWPIAMAKLMPATPNPVVPSRGGTKSPID